MSAIQCVIFDMDGTITDSLPLCVEAFRQAVVPFLRRTVTDEEILATFGPSDLGTLKLLVPDHLDEAMESFLLHYRRLHPLMCPKPFDEIVDLLQWLKSQKVPLGLVTGKGPRSLQITLDELHLEPFFDAIETGSPLHANKPECLRNILKKFDLKPENAVYVGDAPSDISACREVSIPIFSAAWAKTAKPETLQSLQPDKIFYSISDLVSELRSCF
ncbi:phosphoglycolate phosphatase [Planctomycetales bacterium]|nr:phosphoglycolate phosphatase [Planctomycetales bacterium]